MSNRRRLPPRPPNEVEAAFKAALAEGCPHCGSRTVTGKYRGDVWDYRLSCPESCRTHTEPLLAHKIAVQAAERAGLAIGQQLQYRAIDSSTGRIEGAVVARARAS